MARPGSGPVSGSSTQWTRRGFLSGPTVAQGQALVSRAPTQARVPPHHLGSLRGQMGQDLISDVASGGGSPTTVPQGCPRTQVHPGASEPLRPLPAPDHGQNNKNRHPEVQDPLWSPSISGPARPAGRVLTHPELRTPRGSCCTQCRGPGQARGGSWGRTSSGQLPGHGERGAGDCRDTDQEGMGGGRTEQDTRQSPTGWRHQEGRGKPERSGPSSGQPPLPLVPSHMPWGSWSTGMRVSASHLRRDPMRPALPTSQMLGGA